MAADSAGGTSGAGDGRRRLVRYDRRAGAALITLDRPERHNALVPDLVADLRDAIAAARRYEECRSVIIAATGRSFSTGGDVAEFARFDGAALREYARHLVGSLHEAIIELLQLPLPTITVVHGAVTGGSLGLLLASDIVIAHPDATIAPWYVQVGFSPDGGWTALLPDRIGRSRAARWQLTNETVSAATALAWGVVSETDDDPLAAALRTARTIAGMRHGAVTRTTRLLRPPIDAVRARLDAEAQSFIEQIATNEARDGMRMFLDRGAGRDGNGEARNALT